MFLGAPELAPAKINLYLDVLGRRSDGYHELETLFVSLPWGDSVRIQSRQREHNAGTSASCDLRVVSQRPESSVPTGERNLALRAAKLLLALDPDRVPTTEVCIELTKRIPVGAGLGGGSSDAATVLALMAPLVGRSLDDPELDQLARSLGADVPFFLSGAHGRPPHAAIALDRGDRIVERPCVGADLVIVLMLTGIACSTADVFGDYAPGPRNAPAGGIYAVRDALTGGQAVALREAHFNSLAFTAMKRYRKLGALSSAIERRLQRPPALTGTGGTLFDIVFADEVDATLRAIEDVPVRPLVIPLSA